MRETFAPNGVHVLVDGQFGSTGKGLYAAYLAEKAANQGVDFIGVLSNAGPNSGHTFYYKDEKIVLKQLPSFAVMSYRLGKVVPAILTAGAIINPMQLKAEAEAFPGLPIFVHPQAAVITEHDRLTERGGSIAEVAGTRSGTGSALARKVMREKSAVWGTRGHQHFMMPPNVKTMGHDSLVGQGAGHMRYFMEVSQGFSLGLNSQFYPKVTSRECTVMQGIADARIAPRFVTRTFMVIRTFPIRVGNVDGYSSGDHYPDQRETNWQELGVEAERTTVTNRIRRVFTFSEQQFKEALIANQPDFVLANFMNYLPEDAAAKFKSRLEIAAFEAEVDPIFHYGFGPKNSDIMPF